MKPVTFIHCADLHLDSPFLGLKSFPRQIYETIQKSTFHSFSKIVNEAIDRQVDFLIIAGDLYDGEDRSIRAQIFFQREMERLNEVGIPVFVVHGNHDHLGGNWTRISTPKNVHIFSKDVECKQIITKNGCKVNLYGFSYEKKHIEEAPLSQYEKKDGADYHIGILHGHDQQNENHYRYAPFHVHELLEKEFDYWALGHIHKSNILHKDPYILYPGNIQGRHRKELGDKGCYLVELGKSETHLQFLSTATIRWEHFRLPKDLNFKTFEALYQSCLKVKEEFRKTDQHIFVELSLNKSQINQTFINQFSKEDLLFLLQEGEENQRNFVWVYNVHIIESERSPSIEGPFFEELHELFMNLDDLSEHISLLYQNPKTRKYLDELTSDEKNMIIHDAEKLLFDLLKE